MQAQGKVVCQRVCGQVRGKFRVATALSVCASMRITSSAEQLPRSPQLTHEDELLQRGPFHMLDCSCSFIRPPKFSMIHVCIVRLNARAAVNTLERTLSICQKSTAVRARRAVVSSLKRDYEDTQCL